MKMTIICAWCNNAFEPGFRANSRTKFCCKSCCSRFNRKIINGQSDRGSIEWKNKLRLVDKSYIKGENNPNWKNGKSSETDKYRKSSLLRDWKIAILNRDSYRCTECGSKDKQLHVHHINNFADYPDLRLDMSNGKTLCIDCHRETFKGNKFWQRRSNVCIAV